MAAVLGLTAAASHAESADRYRLENAAISVHCPLTVGGSFEARTDALTGELELAADNPGVVHGALSADLTGIDTGIDLRNRHLREKYLEVDSQPAYAVATLHTIRLSGAGAAGLQGEVAFHGSFSLHGQSVPVMGQARLERLADRIKVEASFPVKVSDYGIKKPRHLGVGVKDTVTVKVSFDAVAVAAGEGL
jgi:polyisoprenoid-binding protein YceI